MAKPSQQRAPNKAHNKIQSEAFIEKARELEAGREGAADLLMVRMAKMKPEPRAKRAKERQADE
jgi:hypothetical protein